MIACTLALAIVALALGAFASLQFIWQWTIGTPTAASSWISLAAVIAGAVGLLLSLTRSLAPRSIRPGKAWALLGIAVAFAIYWMVQRLRSAPLGGSDAWGIWNLHARFLSRGDMDSWRGLFDPALFWSHHDYPLLLPGLVSGVWTLVGSEGYQVHSFVSVVFTLLPIGIVACGSSACARDQRGWLAGLVLLATPGFLLSGSTQTADIPLSCYLLITVVCLLSAELWPEVRLRMMGLAGLSAGFAAWTKNDGALFLVAVVVGLGVSSAWLGSWRSFRKDALAFGMGLAPVLILLLAFKAILAPPSDLQLTAGSWERLTDPSRYVQVAVAFAKHMASVGGAVTGVVVSPSLLLVGCLLLYASPIRRLTVASLTLVLAPLLTLCGYFMVYVSTPHDLQLHLETSLDRLLYHLWPAAVFIVFTLPVSMASERVAAAPISSDT